MRVEEKQDLNEHDFTCPISWGKNYPWGYKSIMSFGFFDSHQLIKVRELLSVSKTIDLICSRWRLLMSTLRMDRDNALVAKRWHIRCNRFSRQWGAKLLSSLNLSQKEYWKVTWKKVQITKKRNFTEISFLC